MRWDRYWGYCCFQNSWRWRFDAPKFTACTTITCTPYISTTSCPFSLMYIWNYRVFYALSRYIGRFFIWALVSISITNLLFPTQVLQSTFISLQPDVCSSWCIYEIYCIFCTLSCYIGWFLVWALVQILITNLPFPTWVLQSTPYIFTTRLPSLLFYTWNLLYFLPPIALRRQFFCPYTSDHSASHYTVLQIEIVWCISELFLWMQSHRDILQFI